MHLVDVGGGGVVAVLTQHCPHSKYLIDSQILWNPSHLYICWTWAVTRYILATTARRARILTSTRTRWRGALRFCYTALYQEAIISEAFQPFRITGFWFHTWRLLGPGQAPATYEPLQELDVN